MGVQIVPLPFAALIAASAISRSGSIFAASDSMEQSATSTNRTASDDGVRLLLREHRLTTLRTLRRVDHSSHHLDFAAPP